MPDEIQRSTNLPYKIGSPEAESTEGMELDDEAFLVIKELCKKQIEIPAKNPEQQFFLCPIGLVGAGKTTVLKPLAEYFGLVRISTDEIRKTLKDNGYNRVRTAEIGFALNKEFALQSKSIAIDADCAGPNVGKAILESAAKIGAKVIWIHIAPPEDFIINKLKNFKHTWLFKDADYALASYYRRKPLHENLTMPFVFTFDTSKPDIAEQIEKAQKAIEAALR